MPRRALRQRVAVWAALCGLLLSQALALWHAQVHGAALDGHVAAVEAEGHADAWGHDEGDAGCRLVDQLLVGLGGVPPPLALNDPLPAGLPDARVPPARSCTRFAAFQARAPPRG